MHLKGSAPHVSGAPLACGAVAWSLSGFEAKWSGKMSGKIQPARLTRRADERESRGRRIEKPQTITHTLENETPAGKMKPTWAQHGSKRGPRSVQNCSLEASGRPLGGPWDPWGVLGATADFRAMSGALGDSFWVFQQL